MSGKVSGRVFRGSHQRGGALTVLLAVADHANEKGECWPSIARLAAFARIEERHAKKLLADLKESGELTIFPGKGKKTANGQWTNFYRIELTALTNTVGTKRGALQNTPSE